MSPFKSGAGRNLGKLIKSYRTFNIGESLKVATDAIQASGGDVTSLQPGNGYSYHTFTSPGSLNVTVGGTAEILLVGGGGRGTGSNGGGGGAGGLVNDDAFDLKVGSYTIIVGAGGQISPAADPEDTVLSHPHPQVITALGGGNSGSPGASGGGTGGAGTNGAGGAATQLGQVQTGGSPTLAQFGNAGGYRTSPGRTAGSGGGGAGGAGGATNPTYSGGDNAYGGAGLEYPGFTGTLIGVPALDPLNGYYAGGGSGDDNYPGANTGPGGAGGGGDVTTPAGVNGSGGGGYGGSGTANGGDGIAVIRYRV